MQELQEWKTVEIFEDNDSVVPRYKQVPVTKPKPPVYYESTPNLNNILNTVTYTYNTYCSTDISTYSTYTTHARYWR